MHLSVRVSSSIRSVAVRVIVWVCDVALADPTSNSFRVARQPGQGGPQFQRIQIGRIGIRIVVRAVETDKAQVFDSTGYALPVRPDIRPSVLSGSHD